MGADQQQPRLPSYYTILGVPSHSSIHEIKRAYRKLAMQWHPDRWTRTPSLLGEAKHRFQQIQEAYSVLSDRRKRRMYDAGLYDPEDEEDEGLSDFVKGILNLMAQDRRQGKSYSMEELQTMLIEMARGFESSSLYCTQASEPRSSKRARWDANPMMEGTGSSSHFSFPGWGAYGMMSNFCS